MFRLYRSAFLVMLTHSYEMVGAVRDDCLRPRPPFSARGSCHFLTAQFRTQFERKEGGRTSLSGCFGGSHGVWLGYTLGIHVRRGCMTSFQRTEPIKDLFEF